MGNDHVRRRVRYADMPPDEAERNMRLFADKVMPALAKVGDDVPLLQKTA